MLLLAALTLAILALAAVPALDRRFPPPLAGAEQASTVVLDRHGALLRAFATAQGRWRLPVSLDELDPRFLAMLIAYEDKRFFRHGGIDPLALGRAGVQLAAHRRIVSGGSTLSMQLARLLEPRSGRSLAAKARQLARALQIERRLSKRRILELYLTLAPYGGNLEGVRAASLAYFGKEPRRLALAEAALLVALPQLPEARRPDRDAAAARRARDRVLERMVAGGVVPADEADMARRQPVPPARLPLPALAPHAAEAEIGRHPGRGRYRLAIERERQAGLEALAAERARGLGPGMSVALLLVEHATGAVRARVGSAGFLDEARSGAIDMTRATRSPGSTLKPFVYGLAFEAGLAHPETLIEDRPESFAGYRPQNFDLSFQGTVSARQALQLSLNVPAVALLDQVGPQRLFARFRRAGVAPRMPAGEPAGLAIGLGGVGVSLEELVRLYAALARGGEPVALREVEDDARAALAPAAAGEFLGAAASWYVADILAGTPPPEHAPRLGLAFKTGTSYGYRDAWALGFDGRYVLGVWTGRADGAPVPGLAGREAALPILFDAFARAAGPLAPLKPAPGDALRLSTAELPPGLRRLGRSGSAALPGAAERPAPAIAYPPPGARVERAALSEERAAAVTLKVQGGLPPFQWLADGRPVQGLERRRSAPWTPDGAGFSTLTVIDAAGRSDSITVYVQGATEPEAELSSARK